MADQTPLLQDVRWMVATFFAVWGAGLSTFQQVVNIRQRRPNVRVLLQHGVIAVPFRELGKPRKTEPALTVTVKNLGQVELSFEQLCCEVKVKGSQVGPIALRPRECEPELPATIKHGQNLRLTMPTEGVREAVQLSSGQSGPMRIRATAKDAIGRPFHSNWLELP
jgi:hypothetical protein